MPALTSSSCALKTSELSGPLSTKAGRQSLCPQQLTFGCPGLWKHNIWLSPMYSKKSTTVGTGALLTPPAEGHASLCKGSASGHIMRLEHASRSPQGTPNTEPPPPSV